MIKKISTICFVFLFSSLAVFGQTNKELIKMGDASMVNGQYTNAVHYYSYILYRIQEGDQAIYYPYEITTGYDKPEKNEDGTIKPPSNPSDKEVIVVHKLADAYRSADDYKNAEIWYAAALENPRDEFPYVKYFYGVSLMYNGKFEEAQLQFETFQTEIGDTENLYYKKADSKIASCVFAMNPANMNNKIEIHNMDSVINAGSTSFGLQFASDDYMLFSSARVYDVKDTLDIVDENGNPLELYMLDIYMVPLNEDGSLGTPEKFPFEINSEDYHEGSAVISSDGNSMFFTFMDPHNRNETKIYASRKFNNQWMKPFPMDKNVNMDGFRSMNPYITSDGKTLYFASNRPGGEGGMDIWFTTLDDNGNTTDPENIGNSINTPDEEITPFYHEETNTLYFASGGHIGYGGLDVFLSKWNNETDWWGQAKNAGAPINSSRDDSYFILDETQQLGYLTSDREACIECDSIYNLSIHCNKIYKITKPELKFFIRGYVYDIATNEVIPGATVSFKDVTYKWDHFEIIADENGYYEHELVPNLELFMKADQTKYFADKALVITKGEADSKDYKQDFYLEKIPDKEITIEGIEYDFDSDKLRPSSELILDNLLEFLELNNDLKIEIRSHTDIRGNDAYNLDLSDRRAKSVVDYLVDHGIPRERLVPKGYGEEMPAEVPDADGNMVTLTPEYIESLPTKPLREEAHQRNRRTAFFVLEQN